MAFFNTTFARVYLPLVVLAILLLVGLRALSNLMAEAEDDEEADEPEDLLWEFERARAAGELSEEEFQKIRRSLLSGVTGQSSASRKTSRTAKSVQSPVPAPLLGPSAPVDSPGVAQASHEPAGEEERRERDVEAPPSDPEP